MKIKIIFFILLAGCAKSGNYSIKNLGANGTTLGASTNYSADVQIFTASATWNKSAGAKAVEVILIGGGGAGGSGRRGAAGTLRYGGAGGGGGGWTLITFPASMIGESENVTVGAGGGGGAAVTADDTDGNNGTSGGNSSFGSWIAARGGASGYGGTASSASGGGGGQLNSTNETCGLSQTFRGLTLRTPTGPSEFDNVTMLTNADEIVMNDCTRTAGWTLMSANMSVSGAGGLDTGSEQNATWYEVWAIRNSSNDARNLTLHRAKDYFLDQQQTTDNDNFNLRNDATTNIKIGQGFRVVTAGKLEFIDIKLTKVGSPTDNIWLTIENDSSGVSSGTVLATGDKLDTSKFSTTAGYVRFVFRSPMTTVAATTYHIVLQGDYAVSSSNKIQWQRSTTNAYGNGTAATYNGTTWTAQSGADMVFKLYVTRNDTALTMPTGYDENAKIGYVFNNGTSNFVPFSQQDRRTEWSPQISLGTTTATVPTLLDLSASVPPGPVRVHLVPFVGTLGTTVLVGGIPGGFGQVTINTLVVPVQGVTAMLAGPAGSVTTNHLTLLTEYQRVYWWKSGDTTSMNIEGYEWM